MLKKLTIRAKVILGFALVLCASVALGVFSIQRLSTVNASAKDVATNWLPAANVLGDLSQDFEQMRARQGQLILVPVEDRAEMKSKLVDSEARIAADLKAYEPLTTEGEERQMAEAIKTAMTTYVADNAPLVALVDSGDQAAMVTLYKGSMQDNANAVRQAIRTDRTFQLEQGNKVAMAGVAHGQTAITFIMIALALTAAFCVAIGWLMILGISRPLGELASAFTRLCNSDTSVVVPCKDEVGELKQMSTAADFLLAAVHAHNAAEADKERLRAEAEAERKRVMYELADQFEGAVGGIVEMVSSAATDSLVAPCIPRICDEISSVALAVWLASDLTSDATTAKPRPASPARADSMVALSASRFVCEAMPVIMSTMPLMRSAASESSCTMAAVASASRTASRALMEECST
jgi:methyl-accepting chemotaxis protein